jgi:hypothetical protein
MHHSLRSLGNFQKFLAARSLLPTYVSAVIKSTPQCDGDGSVPEPRCTHYPSMGLAGRATGCRSLSFTLPTRYLLRHGG